MGVSGMRSTDRFSLRDVECALGGHSLPVANLSVGGFYVACEPPLPLGQSVAFELVFADGWRMPAVGRVAWVNGSPAPATSGLPAGCGITITKIAFPDKLAIIDRLRRASGTAAERRGPDWGGRPEGSQL
jgi:Tfp pilus assembly protein PilZ